MIVEEIMKTNVFTLFPTDPISAAVKLMDDHKIRHIPIIDEQHHVIGLITDRDIRDATPSILSDDSEQKNVLNNSIATIMQTNIITGHPLDFVEEIAAIFYEHHISCLPIVKDHQLAGIVTETDLLHTLVELTGAHQPGSQIEILVANQLGVLSDILSLFRAKRANILSVLVYPDKKDEDNRIIVIRVETMNPTKLIADLKAAGHHVLWPNLPGVEL